MEVEVSYILVGLVHGYELKRRVQMTVGVSSHFQRGERWLGTPRVVDLCGLGAQHHAAEELTVLRYEHLRSAMNLPLQAKLCNHEPYNCFAFVQSRDRSRWCVVQPDFVVLLGRTLKVESKS